MSDLSKTVRAGTDTTRQLAIRALLAGILLIAIGYGSAFRNRQMPAPTWGAWCLALGIPIAIVAIMVLGAARGRAGIGPLKIPFAIVAVILVAGFGVALSLPATESASSALYLGLPARAATVIYGIGLLPIFVLPIAYALTFRTQILDESDVEAVRRLGVGHASSRGERQTLDGKRE